MARFHSNFDFPDYPMDEPTIINPPLNIGFLLVFLMIVIFIIFLGCLNYTTSSKKYANQEWEKQLNEDFKKHGPL